MTLKKKFNRFVLFSCLVASLGGFLFGLNNGLINDSLHLISISMHLSTKSAGSFAAILLYGSIFGALLSGFLSRSIGRKNTLLFTAAFFTLFSILSSLTDSVSLLFIYRFILGYCVGIASFIVPLYLSEIAPTRQRGAFIALYQLMISAGIFVIFLTNFIIKHYHGSWNMMFYPITVFAVIMLVLTFFIPKSPRWLVLKNREEEAIKILKKIRLTSSEVDLEIKEINEATKIKPHADTSLTQHYFLKILALGISLQMLQQLTGINTIIYYSSTIFHSSGFSTPIYTTIFIGLINMLSTLIAIRYVDSLGRKRMLYIGLSLLILSLFLLGVIFHIKANLDPNQLFPEIYKQTLVGATTVFIVAYAMSAGPIPWIICAEIFPLQNRDVGLTVTTTTNWVFAALVVQMSLPIMEHANGSPNFSGSANLFFFFGICCIIGILIIRFFCPETKNISLEHMEKNLIDGKKLRHIGS